MINIIDVGLGNVSALLKIFSSADIEVKKLITVNDYSGGAIVIPGVCSAHELINRLENQEFSKLILAAAKARHKIIGICAGFQVLANSTTEDGYINGLNLFDGYVEQMVDSNGIVQFHTGWDDIVINKKIVNSTLYQLSEKFGEPNYLKMDRGINGRVFFNHSFGAVIEDKAAFNMKIRNTKYSAISIKSNIIGIQFHPEKSQKTGLQLLKILNEL